MAAEPIYSFAALRNRLTVKGALVALTALRIGAGRDSSVIGNDLPVMRDALGAPFIPGASLKGAFRARVEALLKAVAPGQVDDLQRIEERMRGGMAEKSDEELWRDSSPSDLTFGAPWIAGRIFFKDAQVDRTLWFGQFEIRNSVALNRDTETVDQGKLFDYEVVPAGTSFDFELALENAEPWQLGMVIAALGPWERGEVQIGGFRSRGLGYVQLQGVTRIYAELRPGDVDALLAFLDGGGAEPGEELLSGWRMAFRSKLGELAAQEQ